MQDHAATPREDKPAEGQVRAERAEVIPGSSPLSLKSLRALSFPCPSLRRQLPGLRLLHVGKGASEIPVPEKAGDEDSTEEAVAPLTGTPGNPIRLRESMLVQAF